MSKDNKTTKPKANVEKSSDSLSESSIEFNDASVKNPKKECNSAFYTNKTKEYLLENINAQTFVENNSDLVDNTNFSADESSEESNQTDQTSVHKPHISKDLSTLSPTLPKQTSSKSKCVLGIITFIVIFIACQFSNCNESSNKNEWRTKVDPNNILSARQRNTIRASLKLVLEKSSEIEQDSVSTLLILSSNEEYAKNTAVCILQLINTESSRNRIPTILDLRSYRNDKLRLDTNLQYLLQTGDTIKGVLLRHIDDIISNDNFEQLRLLFAYCDGENPVISNRLIIMTATSTSQDESELRERFKARWPKEDDFIDALMSRISGHTIFVENGQDSIC